MMESGQKSRRCEGTKTHHLTNSINITCNSFGKLHICRPARQRARRAISINSSYFALLASSGVSMVTLCTVEGENHCSASQATCCWRRGPNVFPTAQLGERAVHAGAASQRFKQIQTPLLPHYCFRNTLQKRSCQLSMQRKRCFPFLASTTQVLFINL